MNCDSLMNASLLKLSRRSLGDAILIHGQAVHKSEQSMFIVNVAHYL